MSLLSETVDPTIDDYRKVREVVKKLTLEEVTEILDRRRTPSNPTHTWKVWQNELKRWQNLCRVEQNYTKRFQELQAQFVDIEEEMEIYGYLEICNQEWLFETTKELFSKVGEYLYGTDYRITR